MAVVMLGCEIYERVQINVPLSDRRLDSCWNEGRCLKYYLVAFVAGPRSRACLHKGLANGI